IQRRRLLRARALHGTGVAGDDDGRAVLVLEVLHVDDGPEARAGDDDADGQIAKEYGLQLGIHAPTEALSSRRRKCQKIAMAAKDGAKGGGGGGGLLGWLRGGKQAEETGRVPVVRVTQGAPGAPQQTIPAPVSMLQKEVALRHVDKGEIARGGMGSI